MRSERNLKKQMEAETSSYAIFIIFTIFVGTPLLFSVSHQFMIIFNTLFEETGIADLLEGQAAGAVPGTGMISISELPITPDFFLKYAVSVVITLSFFGAFLIGLIRTGKPISGLSKIPYMLFISLGLFFLFDYLMSMFFTSLLQF